MKMKAEDIGDIVVENSGFDFRTIREKGTENCVELSWYGDVGEKNRHVLYINYDGTLESFKSALINANETYPEMGELESVNLIRDPAQYRPNSLINLGKELEDNIKKVNKWTNDIVEAIDHTEQGGSRFSKNLKNVKNLGYASTGQEKAYGISTTPTPPTFKKAIQEAAKAAEKINWKKPDHKNRGPER